LYPSLLVTVSSVYIKFVTILVLVMGFYFTFCPHEPQS